MSMTQPTWTKSLTMDWSKHVDVAKDASPFKLRRPPTPPMRDAFCAVLEMREKAEKTLMPGDRQVGWLLE